LGDDDPIDPHRQLLEGRHEQVVGQGPLGVQALELHRDGAGFPGADPDREVALTRGVLEDDDVAVGEHVDADALDHHLDEPVHARIIPSVRGHGRASARPAPASRTTRPTAMPTTNPPMWAKKATPLSAVAAP